MIDTAERRIADFVTAWRTRSVFLALATSRYEQPTSLAQHLPDPAKFRQGLSDLHNVLNSKRRNGPGFNAWTVARLKRNEVRVCNVLAAFWNPEQRGDAATAFLAIFLQILSSDYQLPTASDLSLGYMVRTEHVLLGDHATRMDITIEGADFMLVVEAKIDAPEGAGVGKSKPPQFDRIHDSLGNWQRVRGKRVYFILLSPQKPPDFSGIHADWRRLANAARRSLPSKREVYSFHDHLLADFADHIAHF